MKNTPWHIRVVVTVIATISLVALISCGGAEERAIKYLDKANEYFVEKNYKKAKVEIKNVLQINPKNSDARVLLAKINQKEGEHRNAFQNFLTAAEDDPKQAEARIELAKIYLAGGREEEARSYIDQILAVDPSDSQAKGLLAGLLMKVGEKEKAAAMAEEVLLKDPANFQAIAVLSAYKIDTDVDYVKQIIEKGISSDKKSYSLKLLKIEILKREKSFDAAESIYGALIKDEPQNFKYYDSLAVLHIEQNEKEEAKNVLRLAIKNNINSVEPMVALINFIRSADGTEAAITAIKEFIVKQPDRYDLKKILVGLYIQDNKLDEAKKFLQIIVVDLGKTPDSVEARADLAKIYLAEKNFEDVDILIKEIFEVDPSNIDALVISAKIKMTQNNFKDAIANLRSAIKNEPNLLEAYKLLAIAQEQDGSPDLALDSYFSAIDIDRSDVPSLFGAARLSTAKNDFSTSRKLVQRIIDLQPHNILANEMMVDLMLNNREWENAEVLIKKLINVDDAAVKANGYAMLGKVMGRQERWDAAESAYAEARVLSPKSYPPLAGQVNALLAQKKIDAGIETVKSYIEKYPDSVPAKRLMANLYNEQDKKELAIEIYNALISEQPNNDSLYQNLAGIYLSKNKLSDAERVYLAGISNNPKSASLHILLGSLYTAQKNYPAAEIQYQQAYSIAPTSELVRNNLANLLVNNLSSDANIQKALDLVSVFSNSNEPAYLDTLGWVHFKAGNIPQAMSFLQKAITLKDNPEYRYHLGMALQKSGQFQEAERELLLAVNNKNARGEWIESARDALKTITY